MAKSKKSTKKPSVKVEDLEPEADPRGGMSKIDFEYKPQKLDGSLAITDTNIKFHK